MAMNKLSVVYFCLLPFLLFLAACGHDMGTAQGVAEQFIDQYYVQFNLAGAKAHAVSLALDKINQEIRLTTGQKIDASTQKPRVHYKILEKKESDNRASFLYEGTIQSDDGTSFTRRWLVAVRKEGANWRVSNFSESE